MSSCVRSRIDSARGGVMIEMRRAQLSFGDGLIADEVSDLREDWMLHADEVLADERIVAMVYEALAQRHPKSRSRGRLGAPAEMVLRLLVLKHIRNLSYAALEREVRANLVYREFTRVGGGKMPDAKTMGVGVWLSGRRCSSRSTIEWWELPGRRTSSWVGECASIRPWWKPTSIIRPTALCWGMACAY